MRVHRVLLALLVLEALVAVGVAGAWLAASDSRGASTVPWALALVLASLGVGALLAARSVVRGRSQRLVHAVYVQALFFVGGIVGFALSGEAVLLAVVAMAVIGMVLARLAGIEGGDDRGAAPARRAASGGW